MKSRKRHAKRRFIKSVIVVFVASMLLDFGVHGMLLEADYAELAPQMFRVAAEAGLSAHIHIRGGIEGLKETVAAAISAATPRPSVSRAP